MRLSIAPAPVAPTRGKTPRMKANEVITIGRNRIRAAVHKAATLQGGKTASAAGGKTASAAGVDDAPRSLFEHQEATK